MMVMDFRLQDAKSSKIPLDPGYLKTRTDKAMEDSGRYQQLIGALLYVAVNTRPDIAASVNILSQYTTIYNIQRKTFNNRLDRSQKSLTLFKGNKGQETKAEY